MQTLVIGHRNPDMDSVCSALAYAHLKVSLGERETVAARAGHLNARIQYVLERFGVEAPFYCSDVTPQVRDVMTHEVISTRADQSVAQSLRSIEEGRLRGLPVVDEANRCLGLLSSAKISRQLFPPQAELHKARIVRASVADIARTFEGVVAAGGASDDEVRDCVLMVAAMKEETFAQRLRRLHVADVVLLVGDRDDVQRRAIEEGVRAIIVTGAIPIPPGVQEFARARGVTLIRSRHDTATTVLLARGAVRVSQMVEREFDSFPPDLPLEAARARAAGSKGAIFPVLDAERRLVGVLSKSDFLKGATRRLILVDHNELSQAVHGADKLPIVEVIDHHRLGGFATDSPIHFWNNPVGSTCTIVALLYQQHGVPVPAPMAGLMMAGLIADTLNLNSPTATDTDRAVLGRLAKIAGVDAGELAEGIFSVGSPLQTLSPADVINADSKEYDEDGVRFNVAQIEELGFGTFHEKQAALAAELETFCAQRRLYFAALLVTDINTQNSILLVAGAEEFRREIDYPAVENGGWELKGVVSRKKQLLPYLLGRLAKTNRMSGAAE